MPAPHFHRTEGGLPARLFRNDISPHEIGKGRQGRPPSYLWQVIYQSFFLRSLQQASFRFDPLKELSRDRTGGVVG